MRISKIISKILVILLAFALLSSSVFAQPSLETSSLTIGDEILNITIRQDNLRFRVVEVEDSNGKTLVIFNKRSNTLTISDSNGQEQIININSQYMKDNKSSNDFNTVSILPNMITDENEDLWWGYYYQMRMHLCNTVFWTLRTGNQSVGSLRETSSNQPWIYQFRGAVNNMRMKQFAVYIAAGSAATSAVAAFLAAAPTGGVSKIIGALVALGLGLTAAYNAYVAWQYSRDAGHYFSRAIRA